MYSVYDLQSEYQLGLTCFLIPLFRSPYYPNPAAASHTGSLNLRHSVLNLTPPHVFLLLVLHANEQTYDAVVCLWITPHL